MCGCWIEEKGAGGGRGGGGGGGGELSAESFYERGYIEMIWRTGTNLTGGPLLTFGHDCCRLLVVGMQQLQRNLRCIEPAANLPFLVQVILAIWTNLAAPGVIPKSYPSFLFKYLHPVRLWLRRSLGGGGGGGSQGQAVQKCDTEE